MSDNLIQLPAVRPQCSTTERATVVKCEKDQLIGHSADASLFWEVTYGGADWTDYDHGYTCYGHEPSWEDIEMPDGGKVIQFRVIEMDTGRVVDEYNPMNYDWSDSE